MRSLARRETKQGGFTLVELLVALVVLVVGVLAVVVLIVYGIRLQSFSRDATLASGQAKAAMEMLRVLPRTDLRRSAGGSLQNNVVNHFDLVPNTPFVRRWTVAAGPAGTQDLTVAVISTSPTNPLPPVQIRGLIP